MLNGVEEGDCVGVHTLNLTPQPYTDWDRVFALTGDDKQYNGSSLALQPWYKATPPSVSAQQLP